MTHPAYLKEKAVELRTERKLTMDEIAERLALSRSTIYHWVKDIPIPRRPGWESRTKAQQLGTKAMQRSYERKRALAYNAGRHSFHGLCAWDPTFRDFVSLYIGEGYKRNRNRLSLGNSDPAVVELANRWMRVLSSNRVSYSLQYHVDQNPAMLREFWSNRLAVSPNSILLRRKSNSNGLRGRTWRSRFGVLTVAVNDTQLRARMQGWIDEMQRSWLDSAFPGA